MQRIVHLIEANLDAEITPAEPAEASGYSALAWGSKSHIRTFFPRPWSAAVRLTAVVVFPTPPF